jgi:Uma2 family endonuclease
MEATQIKLITEEALMAMGSDSRIEIIDGEVIEVSPVGILHHIITGNIFRILDYFVVSNKLGIVFMDGLLCLLEKQGRGIKGAQVPDVCFVRKGRIPKGFNLSRPFPGAPDLAVEVMSPDDTVEDVLKRVRKYLYPLQQEVHLYRRDSAGQVRVYTGSDVIEVGDLLPGLSITADACFALPDMGE